jgi:hypothetical protein
MASQHRRAVGIFPDRPKTASALQMLSDSGFAMSHVSVIAKDPDRQTAIAGIKVKDEVTNRAETGTTAGAVTGGVLGGVTGLLVGLGTLTIPGIGPALLAGEVATVLSTAIGAAGGVVAGGLVGALIGMGIPEHRAKHYRDRVAQGDYLVMLKDTEPEIARAERTLKQAGIEDWGVYQASDSGTKPESGRESRTAERHHLDQSQTADSFLDVEPGRNNHGASREADAIAAGRENPYNRVDHPMDEDYPHTQQTQSDEIHHRAGPPHASNPVDR